MWFEIECEYLGQNVSLYYLITAQHLFINSKGISIMVVDCWHCSQHNTYLSTDDIGQVYVLYKSNSRHFWEQELPWFEAELIHGSDCSDEVVLSVFRTIFPLLQHSPH